MAQTVTVSSLVASVRQRANMEKTQFVTDTEIIGYLSNAFRKFYNIVTTTYENYYVKTHDEALTTADTYPLPADFFKLLGVDLVDGSGATFTLRPFELNERNRIVNSWIGKPVRYILEGSNLRVLPKPNAGGQTLRLYYVPAPPTLTSGADEVDVHNGFDEYLVLDAAIRCLVKEESDTAVLERERAYVENQILESMRGRDSGFPRKVTDLATMNDRAWFRWWGI